MPPRRSSHPNCRLEPLAQHLRTEMLSSLQALRRQIHSAEQEAHEALADRLRIDLLSVGELLAQVDRLEQRHRNEQTSEAQAQAELAEVRRAHQGLAK